MSNPQDRVRLYKCGFCKKIKDYPLSKVPLGPPIFEVKQGMEQTQLDLTRLVKDGVVEYTWSCVPCAMHWLTTCGEGYFKDGSMPALPSTPGPTLPSRVNESGPSRSTTIKTLQVFGVISAIVFAISWAMYLYRSH